MKQTELAQWIELRLGISNADKDPASAMAVLEKCAEKMTGQMRIYKTAYLFVVRNESSQWKIGKGETLPLAIALFAKALFSK